MCEELERLKIELAWQQLVKGDFFLHVIEVGPVLLCVVV